MVTIEEFQHLLLSDLDLELLKLRYWLYKYKLIHLGGEVVETVIVTQDQKLEVWAVQFAACYVVICVKC